MFLNTNAAEVIKQKQAIFSDNDFLGLIYSDKKLLSDTLSILSGRKLYLHPFTEFEFLRDVFVPGARKSKEDFLSSCTFGHISEKTHMRIYSRIFENAMLLSQIFAHKNLDSGNRKIGFVDLMLASLLMYLKNKAVLITGNKKDFPSCVFDVVAVLNFEEHNGNVRAISAVQYNQAKFDTCLIDLQNLEKISPKQISDRNISDVTIKIPSKATVVELRALKDTLLSSPGSTKVILLFGESESIKRIELPFKINYSEDLKEKISRIL